MVFMKVRFENTDRQTPANLAIQVRTLPHKFDGLYFQTAHLPRWDLHPVYSGRIFRVGSTEVVLHNAWPLAMKPPTMDEHIEENM
jgi:hypothetical protein